MKIYHFDFMIKTEIISMKLLNTATKPWQEILSRILELNSVCTIDNLCAITEIEK